MLTIDTENFTLTESCSICAHNIRKEFCCYKNYVQDLIDDAKYPDYHEAYQKLLAYELTDSDIVEILSKAKDLYAYDISCDFSTYTGIDDDELITDAIADWCDEEFDLKGTAL